MIIRGGSVLILPGDDVAGLEIYNAEVILHTESEVNSVPEFFDRLSLMGVRTGGTTMKDCKLTTTGAQSRLKAERLVAASKLPRPPQPPEPKNHKRTVFRYFFPENPPT